MKKFLWVLCMLSMIHANEIGFDEQFNLAEDRKQVLEKLLPGTKEYYYYHALYYQHEKEYSKVEGLLKDWTYQHGNTSQVEEIKNRQMLLIYKENPEKTFAHVIATLGLSFNHTRQQQQQDKTYPDTFDNSLISNEILSQKAFEQSGVSGFEQSAFDFVIKESLSEDRLHDLLSKLARPDYPRLPLLVVENLKYRYSRGFGSLDIHGKLLLAQLDECLRRMPKLIENNTFVQVYLQKLRPDEDSNWQKDDKEFQLYLDKLWKFVKPLPSVQNSLKVHTLYNILALHLKQNSFPKELFLEYLKLPRSVPYINSDYIRGVRDIAYLNSDYQRYTMMNNVNSDEALVRSYLQHFFVEASNQNEFMPYINSDYLKELFAETKIIYGIGDMQSWYTLLSPEKYQALKERIELNFLPYNQENFRANDNVSLAMAVKNVKTLIIKTYNINMDNYYRKYNKEVDSSLDLDGLIANHEDIVTYDYAAQRRHVENFNFNHIKAAGIYVIEFIGNGQSSRALLRKGNLICLERIGAAGHVFTIYNEEHTLLKNTKILFASREYTSDEQGEITIPFTNRPGKQQLVVLHNNFAILHSFNHKEETYSLNTDFYVDRESLIKNNHCQIIIHPKLYVSGQPTTLKLLEKVQLAIESTNNEGIKSTQEINDFTLVDDKEATYTFKVPSDITSISFTLKAKVKNLSKGSEDNLSGADTVALNGIDKTEKVEDIYLRSVHTGYYLEVLGKTGEARKNRVVSVELKHRDYTTKINATLQTNDSGFVFLGKLNDIVYVQASFEQISHSWNLTTSHRSYPEVLNAIVGKNIYVPVKERKVEVSSICSLLEVSGNTFVRDAISAVSLINGFLKISNLAAGDYVLTLKKENTQINLHLTQGKQEGSYVLGNRYLELQNVTPLQIKRVRIDKKEKELQLELINANASTRVHVIATNFVPEVPVFSKITSFNTPNPYKYIPSQFEAIYMSGRNIGDEYRYILERKYSTKYPGNMLMRPSLLLNPWDLRKTETDIQTVTTGSDWGPSTSASEPKRDSRYKKGLSLNLFLSDHVGYPNMNFLGQGSLLLSNLRPDKSGMVKLSLETILPRQQLHIVIVNEDDVVYDQLSIGKRIPLNYNDLSLTSVLPVTEHFSEQKNITAVREGKLFNIADITTSEIEVYDSLSKIHSLFSTLNSNNFLQEFQFVTRWQELPAAEKNQLYSKYACHELNFFLYKKDHEFFTKIVKPYLHNKKDKTFMDHWLLGANLSKYLEPWQYGRLNVVERILLGQRLQGESAEIQKQIQDLQDLQPINIDAFNRIFNTALQSSSLNTEDNLGLQKAKLEEKVKLSLERARKEKEYAEESKDVLFGGSEMLDDFMNDMDEESKEEENWGGDFDDSDKKKSNKNGGGRLADYNKREKQQQFFRNTDATKEWVENNYYRLPIENHVSNLINVNSFWRDYAAHNNSEPFLSTNFAGATSNFTEMMLALAVLDIPFKAEKANVQYTKEKMSFSSGTAVIIFHQELKETKGKNESPILINQSFFANDDRYLHKDNERFDKFVHEEFQSGRVYGAQIVVTNPTSARRKVNVLLQIPNGAMPVKNGFYTKSFYYELQPYSTKTVEYSFYFPKSGKFNHYPVHVAQNGELIASVPAFEFNVVDTLSKQDTTSWQYISQNGTDEEVIQFLKNENVYRINLDLIAFRMKDAAFFQRTIAVLQKKHVYNHTLWSYSLLHKNTGSAKDYLQHSPYANKCGTYFASDLLDVEPVDRHIYQHKEYWPLINARTYQLGKNKQILNQQFFNQYESLQKYMRYRSKLSADDLSIYCIYLLLQDRVEEAIAVKNRMDLQAVNTKIQYDYLSAYIHFYLEQPKEAQQIASKYQDYPIVRWNQLFSEVLAQVKEIKGQKVQVTNPDDLNQKQTQLSKVEPSFDFAIANRQITLTYQNVDACQINYYPMDIELLFSRNPFVQEVSGQFAIIQPNDSMQISLNKNEKQAVVAIPEKYYEQNVMIEISGAGKVKSQAYYPHTLNLEVMENYGQVKLTHIDTHKPLSKVYVKVYSRHTNGTVEFYKDGYTDLRGRFDYASLNTNQLDQIEKLSILVLSETHGAIVREVKPPKM